MNARNYILPGPEVKFLKVQFRWKVSGHNLEISQNWGFTFGFGFLQNAIHEQTWVFFIDWFFVWISETILGWEGMVFYQVFLFSNSQIQAVEISSPRKPRVGSKIR